jgi:hypothetical protein
VATEERGVPAPLSGAYALLEPAVGALVMEILGRRSPELSEQLAHSAVVSSEDAEEVQWILYDEFADQLGEDSEPSAYGKIVDNALGAFVARFIIDRDD